MKNHTNCFHRINFLHFETVLCITKTCFTNYKYNVESYNELKAELCCWYEVSLPYNLDVDISSCHQQMI
jgi:hypothetical protein